MSEPVRVDLRTILGTPKGDDPIKINCLLHDDDEASLGVYDDHLWCFGCKRYIRRYASVALLLGIWDGRPETEEDAVKLVRPRLTEVALTSTIVKARRRYTRPLDHFMADSFHRYLLSQPETLCYFKEWRGYTEETINEFKFGWTGSAFSIPVFDRAGTLLGIRFRRDDRVPQDQPKYSGLSGRNGATLYSLREIDVLQKRTQINEEELWVWEGELDYATAHQLGLPSVTMTNGAGRLSKLPEMVRAAGLNPSRWVLATDQDEAGDKAAWELQQQLGSKAVRARWDSNYKDISAFHVAGGGIQDIRLT